MKVQCIENSINLDLGFTVDYRNQLTIGKIYEVVNQFPEEIEIIDDQGSRRVLFQKRFMPVVEINQIEPQDVDCRLPTNAKTRKAIPLCTGLLDYFPDALAAVAEVSRIGNEQHNPGQPLHWERGKSNDQEDCLLRHLVDRGKIDTDGARHSAKVAWRALALLQLEIEKAQGK